QLMQVLTAAVDEVAGGQLADDATALCLDWHPGGAAGPSAAA
ncbi:hypothetical protein FHR75_004428, partial [Kineococcus radiotolerans]|nr:hypothetical protein [Kineococcus radiotolerans]